MIAHGGSLHKADVFILARSEGIRPRSNCCLIISIILLLGASFDKYMRLLFVEVEDLEK